MPIPKNPSWLISMTEPNAIERSKTDRKGLENVTRKVRDGYANFYFEDKVPNSRFFKDKAGNVFAMNTWVKDYDIDGLDELNYGQFRKLLPKRDYIGGTDARVKGAMKIPGLNEAVYRKAKEYGIDPNLMMHRLMKEGFIDHRLKEYNEHIDTKDQEGYFSDPYIWDNDWDSYTEFGLDDAGTHLLDGDYELNDANSTWTQAWADDWKRENEKGREIHPVFSNLRSALDIMAADLNWRKGKMTQKYSPSDNDMGAYINAAYNMGENHKDLGDVNFIRKKFSYPDYYGMEGFYTPRAYDKGGLMKRLQALYGDDTEGMSSMVNEFKGGGNIHIKPSHRGRFTALKERTGKSATWFKEHGTPAQKKMATFALNAKKWKHGDGGFLKKI